MAARRFGVALALAVAAAGCGGATRPPPASAKAVRDPCGAIAEALLELPALDKPELPKDKVPSPATVLRVLVRTDHRVRDALRAVDGAALAKVEEQVVLDRFRGAAEAASRDLRQTAKGLEGRSRELHDFTSALDASLADVARVCSGPKAPPECGALLKRLAVEDDAPPWSSAPLEKLEELEGALSSVAVKSQSARALRDGAVEAIRRVLGASRASASGFASLGKSTKALSDAARDLGKVCPNASPTASATADWVVAPKPDVRKLTVIVRVKPPGTIPQALQDLAAEAGEERAALYRGSAKGHFGSGFLVVRRAGAAAEGLVVTNRHVVDLADRADVSLDDGRSFSGVEILFADPEYDLAVLALPRGQVPFDAGFGLDPAPARDQQAVIATGYPGLADEPSYQTTRGYVSNERLEFDEDGRKVMHFQHTAPIDHGSSGGPVTSEAGRVLGVNTFKARGRENVAVAVPALRIAAAVRRATELPEQLRSAEFRQGSVRDACLGLVSQMTADDPIIGIVERMIANTFTVREGMAAFRAQLRTDSNLGRLWEHDPVDTLRYAVVRRIWAAVDALGGVHPFEVCGEPDAGDWANVLRVERVRFRLKLRRGSANASFRWEHGQWKLASFDVASPAAGPHR